jgi:class 3 adenylate cyclase/pimeloyl-ACP methyl ester carboxylesterase
MTIGSYDPLVEPDTQYALLGDGRIAYQVLGQGPPDLVMSHGTFGSIDLDWEEPMSAALHRRFAAFCRLIRFDRRGSGASDPLPLDALPPWESYLEEVVAVMNAVGSERATVMGMFDAGPMAALFAATKPERTDALILANTSPRVLRSDDYSIGAPLERARSVIDQVVKTWGSEDQAWMQVPSRASDERFRRWFARYTRSIASPTAINAYLNAMLEADARSILPAVRCPTLVLHRTGYELFRVDHGRFLAEHIEGARFVEIPGSDGPLPWEHADLIVDVIEEFMTGAPRRVEPTRAVLTVLFTDIVKSTELVSQIGDWQWRHILDLHDETSRRIVEAFGGRVVQTTGDGVLATFEGPGRGIRAALALRDDLKTNGIDVRSGLHTGEVELRDGGDIGGLAVHIGARVMAAADAGEVLVSRTVRDLTFGSRIRLEDRDVHQLKGISGEWHLYAVKDA